MPTLFVLDVPEFTPLGNYARNDADLTVAPIGNYWKIAGASEISIPRNATGLGQAVWFGVMVGGFEGVVLEFSNDRLIIGPDN